MPDMEQERLRMVEDQIARRGVGDPRVLEAMRTVPRERFVEPGCEDRAYEDRPLPIGESQTISQPFVVALMVEAAGLKEGERALEVGAGSGYAAAVMSRIAARVHAIERHAVLAEKARERLAALGYDNVEMRVGDGTKGWPEAAPFDAIVVSAGGRAVPRALKDQLRIGGRLVIPAGKGIRGQRLLRILRTGEETFEQQDLGGVSFVPLVGEGA